MSDAITLTVSGMSCQHCVSHVEEALLDVPGVERVAVDLDQGRATVEGSGLDVDALRAAVVDAGYDAS
ncbi:MAG: heavy metal-associated domain-containing protein [Thermoleophilia bacterium]